MPRTLFSQRDCMARVTLSNVVEPIFTTRMVPSAMVESRLASAENNSGGVSKTAQLKLRGSSSKSSLACRMLSSSSGFLTGEPAGSRYRFMFSTRRMAWAKVHWPVRKSLSPGAPAAANILASGYRMSAWGVRFDWSHKSLYDLKQMIPDFAKQWVDQMKAVSTSSTEKELDAAIPPLMKDLGTGWEGPFLDALQKADSDSLESTLAQQLDNLIDAR